MVGTMVALMAAIATGIGGSVAGSQYEKTQAQNRLRTMIQSRFEANPGIPQEIRNRWMMAQSLPWNEAVAEINAYIDTLLVTSEDPIATETLMALKEFLTTL